MTELQSWEYTYIIKQLTITFVPRGGGGGGADDLSDAAGAAPVTRGNGGERGVEAEHVIAVVAPVTQQ